MKKNSFLTDVIVKISKKRGKILMSLDLKKIISSVMGEEYSDKKAYKMMYYLKNKGYILSLKKNIFYIKSPQDLESEEILINTWYWRILHMHLKDSVGSKWYIGGRKAIELHFANFEVPDTIAIVNMKKKSFESVVKDKEIDFKTYTHKGKNLYSKMSKFVHKERIGKYSYPYAIFELALLETLYNFDETFDRYTYEYIKKVLKKMKSLNMESIQSILLLGKHHTSVNRLYKILKQVKPKTAPILFEVIKKYSFVIDV